MLFFICYNLISHFQSLKEISSVWPSGARISSVWPGSRAFGPNFVHLALPAEVCGKSELKVEKSERSLEGPELWGILDGRSGTERSGVERRPSKIPQSGGRRGVAKISRPWAEIWSITGAAGPNGRDLRTNARDPAPNARDPGVAGAKRSRFRVTYVLAGFQEFGQPDIIRLAKIPKKL